MFSVFNKLLTLVVFLLVFFIFQIRISTPSGIDSKEYNRIKVSENHYTLNENWLKKVDEGIWVMYVEGSPYERGRAYGVLSKELMEVQEDAFVSQLNEMIPSAFFQQFLRVFISWFNRDMEDYIPSEFKNEIYGVSKSFSEKYDFIGPKFYRILYYHAAHDIGHALADLRIVGCTSFSVNNDRTNDNGLLIGRNFDFYMGDDFAKEKLLLIMKPDSGYAFASYSWAGLTGVVSGINEQGLTVTLNASKSDVPLTAKMPISLLAREILQYAKNVDEAIAIAKKRETFVSETLMIGSKNDDKTILIEKTPTKFDVYDSQQDVTVCANHYQSKLFENELVNKDNIKWSDSRFRHERVEELLENKEKIDVNGIVTLLRDRKGGGGKDIGNGNYSAVNQLIAHHSIVFQPDSLRFWVSTAPFQLGDFLGFTLNNLGTQKMILDSSYTISKDPFVESSEFTSFQQFRKQKQRINQNMLFGRSLELSDEEVKQFIKTNPKSYETYSLLGNYYLGKELNCEALKYFNKAVTFKVASLSEEEGIKEKINKLSAVCN